MSNMEQKNYLEWFWNQPWVMSVTASIFLALSFPPFNLGILQVAAFILLFRTAILAVNLRRMILTTYPAFALWNLFNTYWLIMADLAAGVAAILANALLMLIPLAIARRIYLSNRFTLVQAAFLAAAIWTGYEFLHHRWDLAWPWLTLGNGWSNLTMVIQYISVTGVMGISFWVVFSAALFYSYINTLSKNLLYWSFAVFLAFPVWSLGISLFHHSPEDRPVTVTVIQPNSDSYANFGGHPSLNHLIDHLLGMTSDAVTENTELILWPENALKSNQYLNGQVSRRIADSLSVWNTKLVTGTGYVKFYPEDEEPLITSGEHSGRKYNVYNSAFFLKPGPETETYEKGRLVPIVERFPFADFFYRIDIFGLVDWPAIAGYGLGQEATVFDLNGGKFPALICYDSVFPQWVNRFVDNGADFLTIITNDGWWGDSHGHIQHFDFARLRAIEHRMWIARSANNGISGIISPDGGVHVKTEYWTEDAFTHTIYRNDPSTIYSRFGDWLGFLLLISGIGGYLSILYQDRFKKNN